MWVCVSLYELLWVWVFISGCDSGWMFEFFVSVREFVYKWEYVSVCLCVCLYEYVCMCKWVYVCNCVCECLYILKYICVCV